MSLLTVHCPDCLGGLTIRPRLRQDGRCTGCRNRLSTREDRRRARAAKRADTEAKLADAFV